MVDKLSKERRSWNMSLIRSKNTKPEMILRSLLHRAGYRFRLHDPKLPGHPDIVLKKYQTALFVNGCYWHRHPGCPKATMPSSHIEFWSEKFNRTIERDERKVRELIERSWQVITVWECELTKDPQDVLNRICTQLK